MALSKKEEQILQLNNEQLNLKNEIEKSKTEYESILDNATSQIENLLKNSIDSMKGSGSITIEIIQTNLLVDVLIADTGNGIEKKLYKKIFDPGYTSKERGWGLGLSLSKRIIEDYHKGSIEVVSSKIGEGTTIKIQLKRTIS